MLTERNLQILQAAIQEYINTGKPVSSKELVKKYKLGAKDATIRAELKTLTDEGYLVQPHTSAGRIPSDKGYQYFAGRTFDNFFNSTTSLMNKHFNELANELFSMDWPDFLSDFSKETDLLSAGYQTDEKEVHKSGLDKLFEHLELQTKEEFRQIARDFEDLDENLKKLPSILKNFSEPQVYIGKKSPITKSEHLSVIIDSYDINGNKFYFAAIGPKRMDYEKNLKKIKLIKESTKKHGRK
ncbi:MAG: hypothetical protein PHP03_02365 [Candidatus Pacebacteria bacterium]|nr:hypothetical protein [Candidatus Paceibacterota bacterium]